MPRRKKSRTIKMPSTAIKIVVAVLLALVIGWSIYIGIVKFITRSNYFKVKAVILDPSLEFINRRDISKLIGKNIFAIDLQKIQNRLSRRYPQVDKIRIIKQFPNQLLITARKRLPFAQVSIWNKIVTIDEYGVILSSATSRKKSLPLITGGRLINKQIIPGISLKNRRISTAIRIIDTFTNFSELNDYSINNIDVSNLSKIYLRFSKGLNVIVDRDNLKKKAEVLGILLSRGKLDLKKVRYIDLRFKDPVIGKK